MFCVTESLSAPPAVKENVSVREPGVAEVRRMRVRTSSSSPVRPASKRHFASDIVTVGRVVPSTSKRGGSPVPLRSSHAWNAPSPAVRATVPAARRTRVTRSIPAARDAFVQTVAGTPNAGLSVFRCETVRAGVSTSTPSTM